MSQLQPATPVFPPARPAPRRGPIAATFDALLGPPADRLAPYASLTTGERVGRVALIFLAVTLTGYAVFSRSFAYIGVAPLYVGEAALLLGTLAVLFVGGRTVGVTLRLAVPLLVVMGWGAMCTLPYLPEHGLFALRDAVIWGYGFFALIVCALVLHKPERLRAFVRFYGVFAVLFLVIAPLVMIFIRSTGLDNLGGGVPTFPGTDIPLAYIKGGDIGVHTAGVFGYAVLLGTLPVLFLLLTLPLNGMMMQSSRAAIVCFATALVPYFLYRPRHRLGWVLVGWLVLGFVLLWSSGFVWAPPGEKREFSAENIINSVTSLFGHHRTEEMQGTTSFREFWWLSIVDYTFNGPYFWTGKGYGINLADADGFQVEQDDTPLRSPHNGHMTILARSGVPGLVLWVGCHLYLGLLLLSRFWQCHRRGTPAGQAWARVLLWLGVMHVVFLLNASFDVFLEGPMGGIWFWCLFGTSLAAAELARTHPDLMLGAVTTDGRPVGRTREKLKRIARRVR